ncbi:MAG TPA: GNAT family N-acetyltransferase [Allocoleopsis sp.]
MNDISFQLPEYVTIEKAQSQDKWTLNKLVCKFLIEEVLEFELRVMVWRLIKILPLFILLQIMFKLLFVNPLFIVVIIAIICTIIAMIFNIFLWLGFSWTNPLWSWSKYWIIKYENMIIACATLLESAEYSTISYVYIRPNWRKRKLGSALIQFMVNQSQKTVYLICQPKLLTFYRNLGFTQLNWDNLSLPLKTRFNIFSPHPKLWGFPLFLMEYEKSA